MSYGRYTNFGQHASRQATINVFSQTAEPLGMLCFWNVVRI
jgi:hypothetical protein